MAKKRKQRVDLDDTTKKELLVRINNGLTIENAAKEYGIAKSTVSRLKKNGADAAPVSAGGVRDAIVFLRQAQRRTMDMVRAGKIKEPDGSHLLAMLALRSLEGIA